MTHRSSSRLPQALLAVAALATTPLLLTAPAAGAQASAAPHGRPSASVSASTHQASLTSAQPTEGSAISHRMKGRHRRYNGTSQSVNWAGYAQPLAKGGAKSVSASFVVPTVATSPSGYASTWVGIDGLNNQYLTQVGVSEEAVRGRTQYYAWWEVITPQKVLPEQRFAIAVKPGQRMIVTVSVSGGKATMVLFNAQTGKKVTKVYPYAGPLASAEWIQEDVYVNGSVSPAPNWKQVTFMSLTRNGVAAKLDYKQSIDIVDHRGVKQTGTSKPLYKGNVFTVTWLHKGFWTPVN